MTNPYAANVDEVRILGTSGQNVDDVHKYSAGADRYVPPHAHGMHARALLRACHALLRCSTVGACLRCDPPRAACTGSRR